MAENHYNLVDEKWIPITNKGKVSLKDIFSLNDLPSLGGTPIEKISVTKFLLAIAQSAYTPKNDEDWENLGIDGMQKAALVYLEKWHDAFYLYGEKPFLQMPSVFNAKQVSFGDLLPEIATGNTSLLTQIQLSKQLDESQKALILLTTLNFSFGGKKTDNTFVLTNGYTGKQNDKGKPSTSPSGVSLAFKGLLHNFYLGNNLAQSLYYSLFTQKNIYDDIKYYSQGLGKAPWEEMPQGEDCQRAKDIKESFLGRLVPLCRFCLLTENGVHYTDGLRYLNYAEQIVDSSVAINTLAKKITALWVDPNKKPWRSLSSLLSFLDSTKKVKFNCQNLELPIPRIKYMQMSNIKIWSGGVSVTSNAGEQYVSGADDFVESIIEIPLSAIKNDGVWYEHFSFEMQELEEQAKHLYGATIAYYKALNADDKTYKNFASRACQFFWELAERQAQDLVTACADHNAVLQVRKKMAQCVEQAFASVCPCDTARQMQAFVGCKPNLSKYIFTGNKK